MEFMLSARMGSRQEERARFARREKGRKREESFGKGVRDESTKFFEGGDLGGSHSGQWHGLESEYEGSGNE